MAQSVSQRFLNAATGDSNLPVSKIQLVLGNYASSAAYGSTVASSGDDGSGNYPAAGAIDGDRTELNVGPASTADDDLGLSSWRSAVAPDTAPQTLTITFSQSRTINRFKLYHLSSHGLKSFKLEYWDGSSWIQFAATSDLGGAGTLFTTTNQLDAVDFSDVTTTQVRLTISHTVVAADMANVVELEIYRLIDITDRVTSVTPSRQRDYKLANPMAAQVQIDLTNDDRYFSINHVPTAAEIALGFVNSELRPDMGIIVQQGFNYYGPNPEIVTTFIGTVDSITINPNTRDANLVARDGMKGLINSIDSSKLKTDISIDAAIQYVLNRQNISNYEMSLDSSPINIDYFFTEQQAPLDTCRDLTQAAGDALFYFDELGIASFRNYSGNLPLSHLWTSEIDWESGMINNVATEGAFAGNMAAVAGYAPALADGSLTGDLQIDGANLDFVSSVAFTGDSFAFGGGALVNFNAVGGGSPQQLFQRYVVPRAGTINTLTIGGWENIGAAFISIWGDSGGNPDPSNVLYTSAEIDGNQSSPITVSPSLHLVAQTIWIGVITGGTTLTKFQLSAASGAQIAKIQITGGSLGVWHNCVLTDNVTTEGAVSRFTFTYDTISKAGAWTSPVYDAATLAIQTAQSLAVAGSYPGVATATVFIDAGSDGATWPTTYTFVKANGTNAYTGANLRYWRIRVSASTSDNVFVPVVGPSQISFGGTGIWTSPILDTGSNTIAFGAITDTRVLNSGSITYYTRSSPDGVSWSAYQAVSGAGLIQSPLNRYLQVQVVIVCGIFNLSPLILDITVNWTGGSGSPKYPAAPASFTFNFDSMLLDVQQSLADNLGGDTAILNDIIVQAQPLVLTGVDSNTVWQGTIGTPPSNISGVTPLTVTAGEILTVTPLISGGIDVTRMTGADPAAAVVTFAGGAAGSWVFSSIHPTFPVLVITITVSGTITDLRIIGKAFSNASYIQAQRADDSQSIALYGDRQLSVSNPWIVSASVAGSIADTLLGNFKDPVSYIPLAMVRFSPSAQIGDRVTVNDVNLDMTADYIVIGEDHPFSIQDKTADAHSDMVLLRVPAGS